VDLVLVAGVVEVRGEHFFAEVSNPNIDDIERVQGGD